MDKLHLDSGLHTDCASTVHVIGRLTMSLLSEQQLQDFKRSEIIARRDIYVAKFVRLVTKIYQNPEDLQMPADNGCEPSHLIKLLAPLKSISEQQTNPESALCGI